MKLEHRTVSLLGSALAAAFTASGFAVSMAASQTPTVEVQQVATEIPAAQLQLPPDARPWSEKVHGSLLSRAQAATGEVDCNVLFREPAVLQGFRQYPVAHPARLRWIASTGDALDRDYAPMGATLVHYSHLPIVSAHVPAALLSVLAADPRVEAVSPVIRAHAFCTQGNTLMHVPQVQSLGYNGTGITIAVFDSGVDYVNQPEVSPGGTGASAKTIPLYDYFHRPGDPNYAKDDLNYQGEVGHGTQVAGIAAGSSSGVAPGARIASVKVLDSTGNTPSSGDSITPGINAVLANATTYNIKVANMSLGGYDASVWPPAAGACDDVDPATKTLFDSLNAAGILVVVASGNGGCTTGIAWPACLSNALAVGAVFDASGGTWKFGAGQCQSAGCTATTAADEVACFSDSGSKLDVWAPGHCPNPPKPGGGYDTDFFGTSASAPYASGVAALLDQAAPQQSEASVHDAIRNYGDEIVDPRNGIARKRVRADVALSALQGTACAPPATPASVTASAGTVCSGQSFTLSWQASTGAADYTVEAASDAGFVNKIYTTTVTSPTVNLQFNGSSAATVYVHVAANANCGNTSNFSDPLQVSFTGACATSETYTSAYFVSAIARLPGVAPAYWYSDLSVLNPATTGGYLRLTFFGTSSPPQVIVPIGAHSQVSWSDVLNTAFGIGGTDKGDILVESTLPVTVLARTYSKVTDSCDGEVKTFGQSYPGIPASAALGYGAVGYLSSLRSDGNFRTNVEAVNVGSATTDVQFTFFDNSGNQIGTTTLSSIAPSHRADKSSALPAGRTGAFAEVRVLSPGAQAIAFGSVVDGNSTDPTTIQLYVPQ